MIALAFSSQDSKIASQRIQTIQSYLELHNRSVALVPIANSDSIQETVRDCLKDQKPDIVAGFGEDSLFHEISQVLAFKEVALGVIPCSSQSLIAQELGIPTEEEEACEILISSNPTPLSIGEVAFTDSDKKRFFLQMAGVGLDAKVLKESNTNLQKLLGKGALAFETLRNIVFEDQDNFDIHSDSETYVGSSLVLSNMRNYAGSLSLTPESDPMGADFHGFLFKSKERQALLRFLLNLARGKHMKMKEAESFHPREIKVYRKGTPVQIDGVYRGDTPVEIHHHKEALPVILPKKSEE